ncbi:MAG: nuclear transport factor 2 family protein [Gemmatimonadales bacterium]
MHANAELIASFYDALQRRDHAAMARCYAPDVVFQDEVFALEGWRAAAMWHMLCDRAGDLRIQSRDIIADDAGGSATLDAWYTFSATGRPVRNHIRASFVFREGLIVRHTDRFDLYRWAGQALGLKGRLLGWTPFAQRAIRRNAARSLDTFIRKHNLGDRP